MPFKAIFFVRVAATAAILATLSVAALCQTGIAVVTFHNNYQRWGWNYQETILTPSTVKSTNGTFGVIATINTFDSPIFAQPLVAPHIPVSCPPNQAIVICKAGSLGVHDVVFVATTFNTIYAVDAGNGAVLLKRTFGSMSRCGGIMSTPVIDPVKGILYLMAQINVGGVDTIKLYALDLGSLTNVVAPYSITSADTAASLSNGNVYKFDNTRACQRPALLLLGGKIFAGFSGYEYDAGNPPKAQSGPSRGWLLGWNAADLSPLTPLLTNQEATATNSFFLTSIWMMGAGLASDGTNVYFVTGNSDPSGFSYDPVKNIEESVVKVTSDLKISSVFTPYNYATLDLTDFDFGSGGVMILPSSPPLAVAAGKDGRMFLLNGDSLGGYTPGGPDNVLDMHDIGGCWCSPSFYKNASGMHVVSSGGNSVITWKLEPGTALAKPKLVQDGQAQIPASNQNPGFFTSVSSNGGNDAVIWAVGRPVDSTNAITLYAFDGAPLSGTLPLLGKYPAGTWDIVNNVTSVPVVANGKVYVVSGSSSKPSGTLTIFGIVP